MTDDFDMELLRRLRPPTDILVLGVTTAAGWAVVSREADSTASLACVAEEGRVTSVLPNDGTSPIDAGARE